LGFSLKIFRALAGAALAFPALDGWAQAFVFGSALTDDLGKPTGLSLDTIDGIGFLYVSDHVGGRIFNTI